MAVGVVEDETTVWEHAKTAPEGVGYVEDVVHDGARFWVALIVYGTGIGVDNGGFARFTLVYHDEESLENVYGIEACDDTGGIEGIGDEAVGIHAKDGGDVTGEEKGIYGTFWVSEKGCERWRDELVEGEDGKIIDALGFGYLDGCGDGWCCGFKADAEEDDVLVGVFCGELEGVES